MMKNITKKQAEALLEIAKKASYAIEQRSDLEYRMNDEEDFVDLSVGPLKRCWSRLSCWGSRASKKNRQHKRGSKPPPPTSQEVPP